MRHRLILLFFAFLVVCQLTSCQRTDAKSGTYFAYRKESFRAEIEGSLFGISFCAEIGHSTAGTSETLYIKYLSAAALKDITVYKSTDGTYRLESGVISHSTDTDTLGGLTLPLHLLFEGTEALRLQKEGKMTVLTLSENSTLSLSQEGTPQHLTAPGISFATVWWEREATK